MRAEAADVRLGNESFQIDLSDAVDRVDQRDGIAASSAGGASHESHIGDVRRQLGDDRNFCDFLDPADNRFSHFWILADGGAHAALAHPMRAAEVELEAIGAGIFGAFHEFMPVFARIHHQRCDHGVVRPALLDLGDLAKVCLRRAITDQFNIVEPHDLPAVVVDRPVAGRDVDDRLEPERLPAHPTPAGFERTMRLIGSVRRRAGSDPKRVGGFDAGEID